MIEIIQVFIGVLKAWVPAIYMIANLLGWVLFLTGIFGIRATASGRNGVSQSGTMPAFFKMVIMGVMLLTFKEFIDMGSMSIFQSSTKDMLDYEVGKGGGADATFKAFVAFAFSMLWFIGLIAVLRGTYYMAAISKGGTARTTGEALTFIIFGIVALNLDTAIKTLAYTFALANNDVGRKVSAWLLGVVPT